MHNTNTNVAPYYDDFDPVKDFQKILFQPGPIQARELNQMQSINQQAMEYFGSHLFSEGAMVIPGGVNVKLNANNITLEVRSGDAIGQLSGRDDLFIKSSIDDITAKIVTIRDKSPGLHHVAFIEYITTGADSQTHTFEVGEECVVYTVDGSGNEVEVSRFGIVANGIGTMATVNEGVYFIRGMFIRNSAETLIVSESVSIFSGRIGFDVTETIVNSNQDSSLLSASQGTVNYGRSGADRLKVSVKLRYFSLSSTNANNFIELIRIEEGEVVSDVRETEYSVIADTLAQRTYEQAGDYVVDKHELSITDHPDDPTKMIYNIRPGISYVRGYRVENVGVVKVEADRARATTVLNNGFSGINYGRYVELVNYVGSVEIDSSTLATFMNDQDGVVTTARVIAILPTVATYNDSNGNQQVNVDAVRVYLAPFDTSQVRSANVVNIASNDASSYGTLINQVVYETSKPEQLFPLPVKNVATTSPSGGRDVVFRKMETFRVTLDDNGFAVFSSGANKLFGSGDVQDYYLAITTAPSNPGETSKRLNLGYSGLAVFNINGARTQINVNVGAALANTDVILTAPIIVNGGTPRTKTLMSGTKSFNLNTQSRSEFPLDHYDVAQITRVRLGTVDITNSILLDGGQRDAVYLKGKAYVEGGGVLSNGTLVIEYQYFSHGAGDYFDVDSYSTIPYDDIPSYTSKSGVVYDLRDTIDFRRKMDGGIWVDPPIFAQPLSTIQNDVEYYIPRVDSIYVNADGTFGVASGIPGSTTAPRIPEMSMKLYDVLVKPYTRSVKDVTINEVDNRRYTMRDIGKIERRVEDLEYYTSLNALEQSLATVQVYDSNGDARFKNGIAADPFDDWRLADRSDAEFSASIDINNGGQLRPEVVMQSLDVEYLSGNSYHLAGLVGGGVVTAQEAGQFSLPLVGSGTTVTRQQPYATRTVNINPYAVYTWIGYVSLQPAADVWKDVQYAQPIIINETEDFRNGVTEGTLWGSWVTTDSRITSQFSTSTRVISTTETTQSRQGVETFFTEWETSSVQDQSLKTEVIPFMRSIPVKFVATNLRPNQQVYVFFDGINVTAECAQDGKGKGQDLITDLNGSIKGVFEIPNRDGMRFETGTSVFRISDSPTDARGQGEFGTATDVTFTSNGVLETRQETVTRTRHLGFDQRNVEDSRTETSTRTTRIRRDPISQSFAVSSEGGEVIHSVDIFFATKSNNIPVTLEVRTMLNGFPTGEVITRKTLLPGEVTADPLCKTATKFIFEEFLYLEREREYAIVLIADTQDYTCGVAQMGEVELGGTNAIAKQPSLGVFFTSSNGSTWTPHQNQDMKFTMHRYDFSQSAVLTFDGMPSEQRSLSRNPLKFSQASKSVEVFIPSHGLRQDQQVILEGLTGVGDIASAEVNGSFNVDSVVDHDRITITVATNSNFNGRAGGSSGRVVGNTLMNAFFANIDTFVVEGTSINWEFRVRRTTGGYGPWTAFAPFDTTSVGFDGVVRNKGDIQYRATLSSTAKNITPVINIDTHTTVAITPRVDRNAEIFTYVTKDIMLDSMASTFKAWIGAKIPENANMQVDVYYIQDEDQADPVWTPLKSTTGIVHSSTQFIEHTYDPGALSTGDLQQFVGLKFRVRLTGDRNNFPSLQDFRVIALT